MANYSLAHYVMALETVFQAQRLGRYWMKQIIIFPAIDHMTASPPIATVCVCNCAHQLQNMDVICRNDMSELGNMIVNLELPALISGWEFRMTVVLLNCFSRSNICADL